LLTVGRIARRASREFRAATRDRPLRLAAAQLEGAIALEPGGPSPTFGRLGVLHVYPKLAALDVLDFAETTIWSSNRRDIRARRRVIGEAARLETVSDDAYDAVLSSHVLEHISNPLRALREWRRVVRPGGHILLIVPHKDGTFDHRRPVTTLEHMLEDAEADRGEDDVTHLDEVLALHDLERDPWAPSRAIFEQRCRENFTTRSMHHHVFSSRTIVEASRAAGLRVAMLQAVAPCHIVCLCRVDGSPSDELTDAQLNASLTNSPFASDRNGANSPSHEGPVTSEL
jgi:SAM-dependent methyltransferase